MGHIGSMTIFGVYISTDQAIDFLLMLWQTLILLFIIYWVIQSVSNWFIFKKAGEKPWKALIPFYKDYVIAKLTWEVKYFVLFIIIIAIKEFYIFFVNEIVYIWMYGNLIFSVCLLLALDLIIIIISAFGWIKLGKAFGKSNAFCVGLILCSFFFLPIMAFDDSEYKGNKYLKKAKNK